MTKDNNHNSNFWFGFALGSITLTAAAYLIGTKKGREKLKQLLDYADTMHDMPEELFAMLPTIREMLKKSEDQIDEVVENGQNIDRSVPQQINKSLESLLEKVKHTAEEK